MQRVGLGALLFACVLYACFSSPTPDAPGLPEILILISIAFAALCGGIERATWQTLWAKPLAILVGYGLCAGMFVGVFAGNASADMARDLVGFMALAVPLLLAGHYKNPKILFAVLLFIGMCFAARYLAMPDVLVGLGNTDLLYLANSPLVAFAATWLLLHGCFQQKRVWLATVCVIASALPILAMAGMMQRATLAMLAIAWLALLTVTLIKNPRRGITVAIGFSILLYMAWPWATGLYGALVDKTNAVGWNARGAEITALADTVNQTPLTAIFGAGWGSMFKSPAVGDIWVRFSHSLLTSLWWKLGWVGFLLGIASITALIADMVKRLRHDLVMLCALLLPLLPALLLYGSYKSLCFGLLLLGCARLNWTLTPRNANQTANHDCKQRASVHPDCQSHLSADAGRDGAAAA